MYRTLLVLIGLFFSHSNSFAQSLEIGVFAGGSNYSGDLTSSLITLKETNIALGSYVQVPLNGVLAIRFGGYYGQVSGSDQNAKEFTTERRNLHFRSKLLEGSGHLLINVLGSDRKFVPYLFIGVGAFRFNPQANYQGEWVDLQPLGTEGQGIHLNGTPQYKLTQIVFPTGLGVKFQTANALTIGLELSYRKTFTDYLDDVSTTYFDTETLLLENGELAAALADRSGELNNEENLFVEGEARGNDTYKDGYVFAGLTLGYRFNREKKTKYECYRF